MIIICLQSHEEMYIKKGCSNRYWNQLIDHATITVINLIAFLVTIHHSVFFLKKKKNFNKLLSFWVVKNLTNCILCAQTNIHLIVYCLCSNVHTFYNFFLRAFVVCIMYKPSKEKTFFYLNFFRCLCAYNFLLELRENVQYFIEYRNIRTMIRL